MMIVTGRCFLFVDFSSTKENGDKGGTDVDQCNDQLKQPSRHERSYNIFCILLSILIYQTHPQPNEWCVCVFFSLDRMLTYSFFLELFGGGSRRNSDIHLERDISEYSAILES